MTAAGVVWCGRVQNCIECNNECKNIPTTTTTAAIITTHEPYNKELLCGYLTDTTNNDWRAKERTNNERYAPQGEKKSSVEKITTYTQKSSNHCMKKTFKCWHCTCNDATLTDCSALPPLIQSLTLYSQHWICNTVSFSLTQGGDCKKKESNDLLTFS